MAYEEFSEVTMDFEQIDDSGRQIKCRKRRRCEWCSEWIESGETAVIRVYRWAGDFHNSRQHPECFEALQKSMRDGLMPDCEFEPGDQGRGCLVGECVTDDNARIANED